MIKIPKPNYESPHAHSEFSPSGSKRWISCPASIRLIRELPREEGEPNFYAMEGTCAHELAAFCLDEDIDTYSQEGNEFNTIIVDKEMTKQVKKYIDYVKGAETHNSKLWVENRVSMEHIKDGMFGTADAIIVTIDEFEISEGVTLVTEGSLEVIDLKYGRGVAVECEDNPQLMLYAIGALAHLAKHKIRFEPGQDVKMTIHQPRAPHRDGPVRSDYKTIAQLKDFQKEVIIATELAEEDNPPFGPTEDGCRWCPIAPICKSYADFNLQATAIEWEDFDMSPNDFKNSLADKNTFSLDQLSNILKHTKAIEQWLKNITEYAIEQLKKDKSIKGYKLVYGRSNRAWEDQDKAIHALLEYGTDEARIYNKKFLSPAQAERELTEKEFELIQDMIFKPTGNITLAPEKDGRPAVNKNQEAVDDWSE